jgi:hypothetical protein
MENRFSAKMSMPSRYFSKQTGLMLYPPLPVMASFLALRTRSISRAEAAFSCLLAAHPEADVVAVRQWVREFATAMSMSDMLDDFDRVVARSKSTR